MSKSSLASEWTNLALSGGAGAKDVLVQALKDWRDNRRLLSSIGHIPPAEAEAAYYRQLDESARAA